MKGISKRSYFKRTTTKRCGKTAENKIHPLCSTQSRLLVCVVLIAEPKKKKKRRSFVQIPGMWTALKLRTRQRRRKNRVKEKD